MNPAYRQRLSLSGACERLASPRHFQAPLKGKEQAAGVKAQYGSGRDVFNGKCAAV